MRCIFENKPHPQSDAEKGGAYFWEDTIHVCMHTYYEYVCVHTTVYIYTHGTGYMCVYMCVYYVHGTGYIVCMHMCIPFAVLVLVNVISILSLVYACVHVCVCIHNIIFMCMIMCVCVYTCVCTWYMFSIVAAGLLS